MYEIIQKAHSGVAYVALGVLVIAVINALIGLSSKRSFESKDRTISLVALIACHIQLLLGLIVYFLSPLGKAALGEMGNAELRLTAMEHPLINIIAIVLITIGWSTHKKETTGTGKFKKIGWFYLFGLALILTRIPWNLWF